MQDIGGLVLFATMARTPEYRTNVRSEFQETRARPVILTAIDVAAYVLYMLVIVLTPIVILLGVVPALDAPLYFTLVVLLLLGAGWTLLYLAYAQHAASS
jgi:hypothetical protein